MRTALLAVVAVTALTLAVRAAAPQKIVFTRVFPNAGQIGLFVAARDGSGERPLLATRDMDYDPVWSPDGQSIVFTSDREGSADLFRVKPDGSGLERLTDSPAYDDQAAFSPDGKQLVFVSTRAGGRPNLWTLDIATRRAKALTSGDGGDFRPSWSPDGQWIAFSSSRGRTMPFAHGRWEHLQFADIYVVHPDGTGLKRIGEHGNFCGSPKWTADSRRVVAYCMDVQKTLETRRAVAAAGQRHAHRVHRRRDRRDHRRAGRTWREVQSVVPLRRRRSATSARTATTAGIYYTSGARGPQGQVRAASWSPDGSRVVFHRRQAAPTTWWKSTWSRNPEFELTLTSILPSFSRDGGRFVVDRPAARRSDLRLEHRDRHARIERRRQSCIRT